MDRHEEQLRATAEEMRSRDLSDMHPTGPDADVTVSTSVKLPPDLHQRIKLITDQQGIGIPILLRQRAEVEPRH